ncbi:flagellar motor protein MotB [Methylobacter sp. S3L5C]|uniref:flagellar motor protein MotB n=1 Tax=Methylobacter sp. S3L5C TaxID=2839024 RepID=UPI001FAD01ED|nr:flagellar motor protein MotB [Methylobacter sp. S3L5C]UOA09009.1 flagellar motor protein MotB [Methylobacter sp. S3L5C]
MADTPQRPIIVKRKKVISGGSHGGAWKIAYADFVTAMMAFFLLMWLLGSVDGSTRGGIAEYFKTPLKVSLSGNSTLGESAIILHGGGKDLTKTSGQANNKVPAQPSKDFDLKNAKELMEREEMIKMRAMKNKLDALIDSDHKLQPYRKQLLIDVSSEGLRIQIVDESNRPMFGLSSAELESRARDILRELAPTLNSMPNKISLSGHTDAKPFAQGSKTYSNWELSSDRAHDARRVLVEGGMDESRLMRVIGLSSSVLLDEQDPLNPINRRISIILLNRRAEESAINEGRRQIAPPLN